MLLNGCFCFRGVCAGGPFPFLPPPPLLTSQSEEEVWEGPETVNRRYADDTRVFLPVRTIETDEMEANASA